MNEEIEERDGKKLSGALLKRLLSYAVKEKSTLVICVAAMTGVALCDIVTPLFSRYAMDNFIANGTTNGLGWFIAAYALVITASALLVVTFITFTGKLEMLISYRIRNDAFIKLEELSFSYYDTTPVGYIMARMVSDISRLSEMVAWGITDVLWSVVYIVGIIVVMLRLNIKLALIVLSVLIPLAIISLFFQRAILRHQREVRKINSRITSAFNEGIMGAVTTKTLVREDKNAEEFSELTGNMRAASLRSAKLSALFIPVVLFFGSVGTALALWRGGLLVSVGIIGFGTLSAFISYSTQMFDPIQNIARVIAEFQSAQASAERVFTLIDEKCEIVDRPEIVEKYGTVFEPKTENWEPISGDVEFKDVTFAYKTGEQVLEHFDLKVKAGQNIAIVGETGAGKSTIVNLVCRFYEPQSGKILIDGTDYRDRSLLWLQRRLGYVLQTPHLFSGTIAENIAYADKNATMEQIIDAAKTVNAHEFIAKLEHGYETEVGESGALLSTGQKQLISFARIILANPAIFVLDEATSSIDTETEALIQSAITTVLKGRTSFVIAHRLSTIRHADMILVVSGGKIIERGTHEQLMEQRGEYYDLYTVQLRSQREQEALA